MPYLAHAPMEPLNCTVSITQDKCEIWTGTQFQTLDQMIAGKITGLKPEQVEIHTEISRRRLRPACQPDLGLCRRSGPGRQGRGRA